MMGFQVFHNVSVNNLTGLPVVPFSEETEAMGNVEDFTVYLNPKYSSIENRTIRNMIQWRVHAEATDAFNADDEYFDLYQPTLFEKIGGAIDPNAWTIFFVKGPGWEQNDQIVQRVVLGASGDTEAIALNISISQSGVLFRVFETEDLTVTGDYRLPEVAVNLADRTSPSLFMLSFSTERGMELRDGGQIVSQSDDKRPLEVGFEPNDYNFFRACRGLWGPLGIVNADLGAPGNKPYRDAIEKFLMNKYGIPYGPQ